MGRYKSLRVVMDSNGNLSVLISPYAFLCDLIGLNGSLWVLRSPYVSLCVLIGPDASLLVFMGPYKSLCVLKVRLDWTGSNAKRHEATKIGRHRQLAKGCKLSQPSRAVAQQSLLAGCSKTTY